MLSKFDFVGVRIILSAGEPFRITYLEADAIALAAVLGWDVDIDPESDRCHLVKSVFVESSSRAFIHALHAPTAFSGRSGSPFRVCEFRQPC